MIRITIGNKSLAIGIVILLFFSINIAIITSSDAEINQDDGTWFDTFDDTNDIAYIQNCVVSNGSIKLDEGTNSFNYDYSDELVEDGHEAYATDVTLISGEDQLLLPRNLVTEFSLGNLDYEYIENKEGDVIVTQALYFDMELLEVTYTFTPVHHFRFKIDQRKENIENLLFTWWYGPRDIEANIDSILLYVWNYSYPIVDRWVKVEEEIFNTNSDLNKITFSTSSGSKFVGNDGYIDFLVVGMPEIDGETCVLATDYANITVTTKDGYMANGYVYSELIEPSTLSGWESIIWSSTGSSDESYIKMQIVDNSGNIIENLTGNKEGFTNSPVDLSSLPTTIDKIRLNATLISDDLSISPQLYSWAVTWQTKPLQFQDMFSTKLRIDKDIGVAILDGVTMSEYYSNWPMFGKDGANTRSYEGYGPTDAEIYWETRKETVGGGFRSPVLSEGLIYLASPKDDRIYAYNSTKPSGDYIDASASKFKVDCSVTVADKYLIVPTGEINATNKIYALNKTNLVEEIWSYPPSSSEDIAFASAPTISDEKIFVTSWNAMEWDTPLLSFLYNYDILEGNNKIFALNLIDGSKIWEEDLPAGSFSTPAVDDGVVYVGCDNMFGNSLFAFEEASGSIIWNKSVGLIGRSSPVVYNDKVFIVVKNQSMFSLRADVSILALDRYTGEQLWNHTIAEDLFAFESLPKGLGFYNRMFTSTPAIFKDQLYVTSPDGTIHAFNTDGKKLWTNDEIPSTVVGTIPTFACTSPVIASNYLYVAMPNGIIYAMNPANGEVSWEFNCDIEDPELLSPTYILASPIVADGILYASVTEELVTFSGRIYAIGDFSPNQIGRLISNPIYVPEGYWWKNFSVSFTNTSTNFISFDILDEDDNELLEYVEDGDNISDSSKVNSNVIKLQARFTRQDKNETPELESWGVSWYSEKVAPVFDISSFIPDPSGWINTNTPVFSIRVRDAISGLDLSTGKYTITYENNQNKTVSEEFTVEFSNNAVDGTNNKITLTADISSLDIASKIRDLKSIEFLIKDLAGNKATYTVSSFKKDTVAPTSSISFASSFLDIYNKPISITATTNDDKSGVKSVGLYFREPGDDEWDLYEEVQSPFSWSFDIKNSSDYELCTIAKDLAGNMEDFPDEEDVKFVYDGNPPYEPDFEEEYRFNKLPELSVKFEDDYELKDVYYRLNFHGLNEWTKINDDDIDSKTYTGKWTLSEDDWEYIQETIEYYMFFKLVDAAGNEFIISSDNIFDALTIIKDLTASRSYINIDDIPEWSWDDEFTITAELDESEIEDIELNYRYSSDNENWDSWETYGDILTSSPFEWLFTAKEGSGYYQFKTVVTDAAGNTGESEPETVSITMFPIMATSMMVLLIIILMVFTIFINIALKKRS